MVDWQVFGDNLFGSFILVTAVAVGIAVWVMRARLKLEKEIEEKLESLPNVSPTQKVVGVNLKAGLAVEEDNKMISLVKNDGVSGISARSISYKDLISTILYIDDEVAEKAEKGNSSVSDMSVKPSSLRKASRVDLRLLTNDTESPFHDVCFMECSEEEKNELMYDMKYKSALDQARHWHGLMAECIRAADVDEASQESVQMPSKSEVAKDSI